MEMALHSQSPLCRRGSPFECAHFAIRPIPGPFSQSLLRFQDASRVGLTDRLVASSDYSKRRSRRRLVPKTKSSAPKGFSPRPPIGISNRRKDQTDVEEKASGSSTSHEVGTSGSVPTERKIIDEAQTKEYDSSPSTLTNEVKRSLDKVAEAKDRNQKDGDPFTDFSDSSSVDIYNDATDEQKPEVLGQTFSKGDGNDLSPQSPLAYSGEESESAMTIDKFTELRKQRIYVKNQIGRITISEEQSSLVDVEKEQNLSASNPDTDANAKMESLQPYDDLVNAAPDMDESLIRQKELMDAEAHKLLIENLAEDNFSRGNKIFVFPDVVKPGQVLEVFLNRSLSALANEPDILIKGGFNGWKWKLFTEKMQKTDLDGDWWSCQLSVPEEAYRIDVVFFNGDSVYENNNSQDFVIPVEGAMNEAAFEDFLLEEKHRELEKIAAEQAEREKQAEEQRRMEAEKAANEANRAQAKVEVEKKRSNLHHLMKLATQTTDYVIQIEPTSFNGGDKIRIYYNRSSRPLAHASEIWIHGGYNNWDDGLSIVEQLSRSEKVDGDWWYADVIIPEHALVIDWVFADRLPGKATVYDNNNRHDFHATVAMHMSEELFWVEEEQRIYKRLQEERRLREKALHEKAEKSARMKAEMKEKTMKQFLLSQKHIVYTEPLDVQAGSTVSVLYNPSNTILNGKPEVWFRCSFNRWTHRSGPLPPQKMVPADNGSHLKAIVKVPLDAYMMDFVFSESEEGGLYDNRQGMDYHIPVAGGIAKEPPMHIVHISVEMAPIAKVGGLGDVVTSLSRAVQDLGHTIDIILPKYDCMNLSHVKDLQYHQSFGWSGTEIKVWFGKVEGLSVYFLEPQNGMFWVGCIYGRNDAQRFDFFCHAALEFLLQSGSQPDILHCHDWSSAPVAWLFKEHYKLYGLGNAQVIFTIHNLEFGVHQIGRAMLLADKATTVSPTYSKEVSGHGAISPHLFKFHGILNGIDPDIWDPFNDNFIPVPYTSENVVEGKKAAKEALQQRLGLKRSDHPLVGIITRLTVQKGIHLIKHAIWRAIERGGQVVLLGSAPDPRIQNDFVNLANQLHSSHADRVRLCLTYDEPLSHLIYAGADFILVPSLFEPCGLTQLIAMRYGSIPVVRKTGGLYDTVYDVDNDKERARAHGLEPNGFNFDGADPSGVDYALDRAISVWYDRREWFNSLCKVVMEQDWSWNRPALDYMELYYSARK